MSGIWRGVHQDPRGTPLPPETGGPRWRHPGHPGPRRRDARAAQRFFRKLFKGQGESPWQVVTDKLGSYAASRRDLGLTAGHRTGRYENNRAEVPPSPAGGGRATCAGPSRLGRSSDVPRFMRPLATRSGSRVVGSRQYAIDCAALNWSFATCSCERAIHSTVFGPQPILSVNQQRPNGNVRCRGRATCSAKRRHGRLSLLSIPLVGLPALIAAAPRDTARSSTETGRNRLLGALHQRPDHVYATEHPKTLRGDCPGKPTLKGSPFSLFTQSGAVACRPNARLRNRAAPFDRAARGSTSDGWSIRER